MNPTVDIASVRVHRVDFEDTLQQIAAWVAEAATQTPAGQVVTRQICTVNPEFVVHAHRDPTFAGVLARADLCVADGVGILLAARLQGVRLAERVTGSDGVYRIAERAAAQGWRIYLLGAAPGVAELAGQRLQALYPRLTVAGAYAGSPHDADWPAIRARLAAARPDILLVAYGHPAQELWIDRHRGELPAAMAMGVGGAFDFVAGVAARAPRWVRRLGLEWLHRLMRQPWRWRRMLSLPVFVGLVARQVVRSATAVRR